VMSSNNKKTMPEKKPNEPKSEPKSEPKANPESKAKPEAKKPKLKTEAKSDLSKIKKKYDPKLLKGKFTIRAEKDRILPMDYDGKRDRIVESAPSYLEWDKCSYDAKGMIRRALLAKDVYLM